jgi:hypothetical protein
MVRPEEEQHQHSECSDDDDESFGGVFGHARGMLERNGAFVQFRFVIRLGFDVKN